MVIIGIIYSENCSVSVTIDGVRFEGTFEDAVEILVDEMDYSSDLGDYIEEILIVQHDQVKVLKPCHDECED